ncbi:MAG TPA: glycosyltransferase [Symbiobacteriaceae bacterium]|nr:glycosyltransferase [Symbiobacteriaceae bacterium]
MRLLLFSANFGSGHLQAARAVAQAHRALHPENEAIILNMNDPLMWLIAEGYLRLLRWAPGLYRLLYGSPASPLLNQVIQVVWRLTCLKAIARHRPDVVVATHPFPGLALAELRQRGDLTQPVHAIVTDWEAHTLWLHQGFDHYFVAAPATRRGFEAQGIPAARITVTGIPVRPAFGQAVVKRHGRSVLVMGGGLGLGPITKATRSLAALPQPDLQVTVVCGQNGDLYRELTEHVAADPRFTILGYDDAIHELMAKADLLLTKPGGISSAEALVMGLPLLLLAPLPGQEEENAAHLVETGAARPVATDRIGRQVRELLFEDQGALAAMQAAAYAAGRPRSADLIANHLKAVNQVGSPA